MQPAAMHIVAAINLGMHLDWIEDCLEWRGGILWGQYGHYCCDWDGLPIDETCPEWPCCDWARECLTANAAGSNAKRARG